MPAYPFGTCAAPQSTQQYQQMHQQLHAWAAYLQRNDAAMRSTWGMLMNWQAGLQASQQALDQAHADHAAATAARASCDTEEGSSDQHARIEQLELQAAEHVKTAAELEDATQQLTSAKQQLQQAAGELAACKQQLSQEAAQHRTCQQRLEEAAEQLTSYKQQLQASASHLNITKAELAASRTEHADQLQRQQAALCAAAAALQTPSSSPASAAKTQQRLTDKLSTAGTPSQKPQGIIRPQSADALKSQLSDAQQKLQDSITAHRQSQDELADVQQQLQDSRQALDQAQQQLAASKAKSLDTISQLKQRNKALKEQLDSAKKQLAIKDKESKASISKLVSEMSHQQNCNQQQEAELAAAQEAQQEAERQLAAAGEVIKAAAMSDRDAKEAIGELQVRCGIVNNCMVTRGEQLQKALDEKDAAQRHRQAVLRLLGQRTAEVERLNALLQLRSTWRRDGSGSSGEASPLATSSSPGDADGPAAAAQTSSSDDHPASLLQQQVLLSPSSRMTRQRSTEGDQLCWHQASASCTSPAAVSSVLHCDDITAAEASPATAPASPMMKLSPYAAISPTISCCWQAGAAGAQREHSQCESESSPMEWNSHSCCRSRACQDDSGNSSIGQAGDSTDDRAVLTTTSLVPLWSPPDAARTTRQAAPVGSLPAQHAVMPPSTSNYTGQPSSRVQAADHLLVTDASMIADLQQQLAAEQALRMKTEERATMLKCRAVQLYTGLKQAQADAQQSALPSVPSVCCDNASLEAT